VGTSSKSYKKLKNTDFGDDVVKSGRITDLDEGTYWIYEVASSDLNVSKKNPALVPVIDNLGDDLGFAYPLVERQMDSRSEISDFCFSDLI